MPDWTSLRRRAVAIHLRLRGQNFRLPLVSAEALLAAAEAETGLSRVAVAPDDSLLAGAHAVLDRDMGSVWYAQGASIRPSQHRLAQAHEFGHYWLHPDLTHDACATEDDSDAFLPPSNRSSDAQIAVGYSYAERRETEANLFAVEFLLPSPLLRRAYLEENWSVSRIASRVGVSETCVLAQLANALLLKSKDEGGRMKDEEDQASGFTSSFIPHPFAFSLDTSQRAAAEIESGPALVDAGPGTGKTRTLVARMLTLLGPRRTAPENILALTFSNRAAEEMRTRLRERIGDGADRVWIGTFHAFGFEILRKYGDSPHPPRLLETADAVSLLESRLDLLDLHEFEYLHQPSLPFPDILRCISRAKDELKTPEDYRNAALRQREQAEDDRARLAAAKSLEVAHVYAVYQRLLDAGNLVDFGDLIMRAVERLDEDADVCARLQEQYPHVLADEYQDINRASAQLLRRLAGDGKGFWAVGDLRQAIYRFRGASPANVLEFERDFPGGRRLRLDRNYRSRAPLVSVFSAYAAQMPAPTADSEAENTEFTAWQPLREGGEQPSMTVAVAPDEEAQADGLAGQIRAREQAGTPLREQTILCRTNAQAADLSARLEARGLPTQHLGSLFAREEVKDLLALTALACEPEGTALARVALLPEYAVPSEDVTRLLVAARKAGRPFPAALALADELPELSEAGRQGLQRLRQHLEPILYRGNTWLFLTRFLFEMSGYMRPLLASDAIADRQKLLALHEFLRFVEDVERRLVARSTERSGHAAFLAYLRHLMLCGEDRPVRLPVEAEVMDAVRLMTVHAAKGLEFPVVYLPNLIKDQFPPRKPSSMVAPIGSEDSGAEKEDGEDCLFFVALSRARDHLILSRPATWRGRAVAPSPLLQEIEQALWTSGAEWTTWERREASGVSDAAAESSLEDAEEAQADESAVPQSKIQNPKSKIQGPRPTVTLSALQQYQDCPRRYYYQRVARLPEREGQSVYLHFHRCLQVALSRLQTERSAGNAPSLPETLSWLETLWAEGGIEWESAYARLLHRHAERMLTNAHESLPAEGQAVSARELVADLPNGQVSVPCDHAEELPDGTLRLLRHIRSRARSDDHTDPRLALMRHAARQQEPDRPVQIAIGYLREGETKEVREAKRYEPARVEKFDKALQGIRDGRFPAAPDDRKCAQCPFLFICPV